MVDTYNYLTELGKKGVVVNISDSEVIAAVLAVIRKRIYEAMDVSDYAKVEQLAHEADELNKVTATAFAKQNFENAEEEEVNVDLRTGEIVSDKSEETHD